MRRCVKLRCDGEALSTVSVRYADRSVLIGDLSPHPDPNTLDMCREHADSLTAPLGWETQDRRRPMLATEGGVQVEARSA